MREGVFIGLQEGWGGQTDGPDEGNDGADLTDVSVGWWVDRLVRVDGLWQGRLEVGSWMEGEETWIWIDTWKVAGLVLLI